MKILFILVSIAIALLPACTGKKTNENTHDHETHQHDDGSVHQNHQTDTLKQEEFTVPVDSSLKKTEKEHSHEEHDHTHTH